MPNGELNDRDNGDTESAGPMPVPVSATVCGLPGSELVTTRVADLAPSAVGRNITVAMVQLLPLKMVVLQVEVNAKSPGFAPAFATWILVRDVGPRLVSMNTCGALLVPTIWLPKAQLAGVICTALTVSVPLTNAKL